MAHPESLVVGVEKQLWVPKVLGKGGTVEIQVLSWSLHTEVAAVLAASKSEE